MATIVGRYWPNPQRVSIVNPFTGTQIQFDHPSDMISWFDRHPEDLAQLDKFRWYTGAVSGGH